MHKIFSTSVIIIGLSLLFAMSPISLNAQNDSAIFELESTDKGVLIPRMTTTQRENIINPDNGLLLYDTDDNLFYYFDNGDWWPLKTTEDILESTPTKSTDTLMNIASYIQDMAKKDDVVYLVNENNGKLVAVDVSDPYNTTVLDELLTGDAIYRIAIKGNHAFVTNQEIGDIKIVNISDPANLVLDHTYSFGGNIGDFNVKFIAFYNDIGYVCVDELGTYKIHAIDFTNPTSPSAISSITVPTVSKMKISGEHLYFSTPSGNSLRIIDITNPNTLSIDASFNADGIFGRFDVEGNILVYIDDYGSGNLNIVDINNPLSPVLGDTYALPNYGLFVSLDNGMAYVSTLYNGLITIDVSDYTQANFISDALINYEQNITLPMGSWLYVAYRVSGSPPYIIPDFEVFNIGHDAQSSFVDRDGNTIAGPWKKTNNTVHTSTAVSVGKNQAANSAILELESSDKGFLIPRMTTSERNAISAPAQGLQIFNTESKCLEVYHSSKWFSNCGQDFSNSSNHTAPQTASWTQMNDFSSNSIYEGSSFTHNGIGYLVTAGLNSPSTIYKYDESLDSWTYLNSLDPMWGITGTVAFVIGDYAYIGTGYDKYANEFIGSICQYDILNNTIIDYTSFSDQYIDKINESSVFVIDDIAYMGTGQLSSGDMTTEFFKYDPVANLWTQISSMPGNGKSNAVAFSIDGYGYVGTGLEVAGGLSMSKEFYKYDPNNDLWSQVADLPGIARSGAVAFVYNGYAYVGSGNDFNNPNLNDFYRYDHHNDTWTQVEDMLKGISAGIAFSLESAAYFGTGYSSPAEIFKYSFDKYLLEQNVLGEASWTSIPNQIQNLNQVLGEGTDAGNQKITNLANPTSGQDAATKAYVDANDDVNDADSSPTNEIQTLQSVLTQGTSAAGFRIQNLGTPILDNDATNKAYVDAEAENALPLNATWSNYGGPFKGGTYYKDNYRVYLDGLINKSSSLVVNDIICTLPNDYRPTGTVILNGVHQGTSFRIDILSNGQMVLRTIAGSVNNWISLTGLNYSLR